MQTGDSSRGVNIYNRSSAVDVRVLASRGRQANPVLTYTTALRRFFGDGGVLRRWRIPMWGGFFNGYVFAVGIKNNDSPDWRGRYLKNYV